MLTSPVNVVAAASNGAALKPNASAPDHGPRREPQLLQVAQAMAPDAMIEPTLPSNSLLTHVNAVAATAGNRTILQELSLNLAATLRIARRPEENLTALFLRILAAIEAVPQAERLAIEIKAGLKPLKITLSDLAMALRKPDGPEAARLTAIAEAPTAIPGRTAANAANASYLKEGTDDGHAEETLAMRAAARNSAAGQGLFSAENRIRPADTRPVDAKVLQSHLKTMFEPGDARKPQTAEGRVDPLHAAASDSPDEGGGEPVRQSGAKLPERELKQPETRPAPPQQPAPGRVGEQVAISSASLKLDPPTVEKIRNAAQAIAEQDAESQRQEPAQPTSDATDDRRLQTMLTLKGLAEVVATLPAKAAELLATVVADAASPVPGTNGPGALDTPAAQDDETQQTALATGDDTLAGDGSEPPAANEILAEQSTELDAAPSTERPEGRNAAVVTEERQAAQPERLPAGRADLVQHAVPFAYAPLQPAREEMVDAVEEEETGDPRDEEEEPDGDEDRDPRRPRDEYDAIHDPLPEDEPAVVITRDSSEADRAFALYQRMGGF
ncbi:MAG: hypothetical protein KL863_16645 [Rhizobium sp.]|nr:hypothetical protein [Rhizobium sp.]